MNHVIPVSDEPGLVRDVKSGAILNRNTNEYQAYLSKKEAIKRQKALAASQAEQINNLQNELAEIKELLKTLIRD